MSTDHFVTNCYAAMKRCTSGQMSPVEDDVKVSDKQVNTMIAAAEATPRSCKLLNKNVLPIYRVVRK